MATLGTFAAFASRAFTGGGQFSLANVKFPTGGNYIIDDDGYGNRVHVFTTSGTFAIPADVITSSTVSLKVLSVGGGGDAGGLTYYNTNGTIDPDNAGGGGAGGSVVYSSGFTSARGMSFAVTVGAAGGSSIFEGLHASTGGGNGGTAVNFSRGEPGGRGGGGSWQNGRPSGPRASAGADGDRHPGYWYGTSGPAAPANYIQISTPALGPDYNLAPSCTIPISYADSLHGIGNNQYRTTLSTPDAGVPGLANKSSPYGGSFRSRGGGGASWTGGWGGIGVRTNFFKAQHDGTTYEWIGSGGHGKPGHEYTTIGTYDNAYIWRDSGNSDAGTQLSASFVPSSTPVSDKFLSSYQNQYSEAYLNPGYNNIGSGGGFNNGPITGDGQPGILRIAYKLSDYPGGSSAATANIFGGDITTSTDGQWRYHTWVSAANKVATSINSQGYYISTAYRPYQFETSFFNGATTWPLRTNLYDGGSGTTGSGVANTTPFYYYGDIPAVTGFFKYLMVAGGGARGRGAAGTDSDSLSQYQEFHYGGGGAGGIKGGTFDRESRTPIVTDIDPLQDTLANTKSDGTNQRYYSNYFDMRPGYFEVRANSMLNDKLEPYAFEYMDMSLGREPNRDYRERNGRIRLAALCKNGALGDNEGQGPMIDFLRCVRTVDLDNGVWGNDNWGSNTTYSPDSEKAWLVFYSRGYQPSNPYTAYINPVIKLTNYDGWFYNDFFKVVLYGRNGPKFTNTIPNTGDSTRYKLNTKKGTWIGPDIFSSDGFTARTISGLQKNQYFVENRVTGVHPVSNENYYNMLLVDSKIPTWQNGNDRWNNFWNNVVTRYGSGTHPGGATNNFEVKVPPMVQGLDNVDSLNDRWVYNINGDTIGDSGKNYAIQYVIQRGSDESTRKFDYRGIHGSGDLFVPAGWKMIQNTSTLNNDAKLWNGTTVCLADGTDNEVRRASVKLFVWLLRKLVIRRFFVHDVQVGRGGGSGRIGPWRYRSGAPTCFHKMDSDSPSDKFAGGGGGGGHRDYTSGQGVGDDSAIPDAAVTSYYQGQSNSLSTGSYDGTYTGPPWGAAGGGAWRQMNDSTQSTAYSFGNGGSNGSGSQGVEAYGGGGTGGGSINVLSQTPITFYGAPRGEQHSEGRKNNKTDIPNDAGTNQIGSVGQGGAGSFGGISVKSWTYDVRSITCGPNTYYYGLNMNTYPHNAGFSAGGGGGSENGFDASNVTGGAGSSGFPSSITGVSIPYGSGGGGFGRIINGNPGSSLPPNPADQTAPIGAPAGAPLAPAYVPYGSGGGWSAGKQEGGGADGGATKYYPGSGPWPASYPVGLGEEHMDAMRFWYTPSPAMPSPQKGDVGRPYGGKQGVVIVSYNKGPFIYPV